ncbi:hypothetical protein CBM2592_B80166 [Cupriavidus taiwanensis]|nr:hypothetical protein CBM2592_B80166 [Cupriavidus taiwanensis]SOY97039.1 hypothetical protein CBM2591_B60166 [Cupriavidus taiwanensis]SOZ66895.1 hypothetical protein CBM2617_B100163 [Cupriavidus taiwanensis]
MLRFAFSISSEWVTAGCGDCREHLWMLYTYTSK